MKLHDLTGQRFSFLLVTSRAPGKPGKPRWNCTCDCGKECVAFANKLRVGGKKSCGCREGLGGGHPIVHGHCPKDAPSLTWKSWRAMIGRCCNANAANYDLYGGRGITVCERWRDSFENFLADMGERPSKTHSIDRFPDGNGNYEPDNCRWATASEQARNRRNTKLTDDLAAEIRTLCKTDERRLVIAARFGISRRLVDMIAEGKRWAVSAGSTGK